MVFVPAGDFLMGSVKDEPNVSDDEKPQHTVYLDSFWIDRYEVTNVQYKRCVDAGKCQPPKQTGSTTRASYYGNALFDNYPVIWVSWGDANAYCQWAGKKLPTEAQWEKAARDTDGRVYPWGNDFDQSRVNAGYIRGDTTEVGSYPNGESPYGALDMAGNVWEWVADWYDETYYSRLEQSQNSPPKNPQGPSSGQSRVRRGNSWGFGTVEVRAANRDRFDPTESANDVGFRCAQPAQSPQTQ